MIRTRPGRGLAFAVFALAVQACAGDGPPSASRVVEKYMRAIGGRDAAERFPARHLTAEMSIPATGTTVSMEVWTKPVSRILARTETNGTKITTGFDGTTAWAITPLTGARILDRATIGKSFDDLNFGTVVDFARAYPTMETLGERTVDGHACWNVRMVSKDGFEVRNCFDKDSGLLVSTVVPGTEGAADMVMSDYRDFDGLRMPTRLTTTVNGQRTVTTIRSISHAPIADSVFAPPAEVRALMH